MMTTNLKICKMPPCIAEEENPSTWKEASLLSTISDR